MYSSDFVTMSDPTQINAGIVRDLATGIATTAPKAFVLVISNPVNSTVPIVAEVFKQKGVFDPKKYAHAMLACMFLHAHASSAGSSVLPPSTSSARPPSSRRSLATSPSHRRSSFRLSAATVA